MIHIKTPEEIEKMRTSGYVAALILKEVASAVKPGITTNQLNDMAEKLIEKYNKEYGNVKSSFKGYAGFPCALCASVNSTIVHGAPNDIPLEDGDNVGLDFGVAYYGWHSDTAVTISVGTVDSEMHRILRVCKKALKIGIKKARPGSTTGDIGNTIQRYVESQGYEVVRDLAGHGVGREPHEEPEIPNFGKRHSGTKLEPGMVIAIEPMITKGRATIKLGKDSQAYDTDEAELNAHFEDTILITKNGNEVLTKA